MVKRSTAKIKGAQFEYDCQASLEQVYSNCLLTKELGFQKQFDILFKKGSLKYAVECKRHAKFSWNQLVKLHQKLEYKAPDDIDYHYLLFKPNQQPCLVMYKDVFGKYYIQTFEAFFGVSFIKHKSTRAKK